PLAHLIDAAPPGRRSIAASLPNQAPRPSAVVSAAHTAAGGRAGSTVRSIRSGKAMTASRMWQPFGCYFMATVWLRQVGTGGHLRAWSRLLLPGPAAGRGGAWGRGCQTSRAAGLLPG